MEKAYEMSALYEEFMYAGHRFLQSYAGKTPRAEERPTVNDAFISLDNKLQELREAGVEITEAEYSVLRSQIEFVTNFGVRAGFLKEEGRDIFLNDNDPKPRKMFEYSPQILIRL